MDKDKVFVEFSKTGMKIKSWSNITSSYVTNDLSWDEVRKWNEIRNHLGIFVTLANTQEKETLH